MNDNGGTQEVSVPTRVCRRCSTQSETGGDLCPHCGKSYTGRRRPSGRVLATVLAVLLVAGIGTAGAVLKSRHDHAAEVKVAAKHAADAAAARRAAAKAEADAAAAAKKAKDHAARQVRRELVREMQASITKDAKKDVTNGVLDGPILSTSCNPLGGGSTDDLTALTTTFECLAVTKKNGDGTESGYRFAATANWNDSSYTWHLGS